MIGVKKKIDSKHFFSVLLIGLLMLLLIIIVSTLSPIVGGIIKLWFMGVGVAYFANELVKKEK